LTGTALVAAARLGARCAYVGVLGDDDLSRFVADALAKEGVDMGYAVRRTDARPALSTVVVDRSHGTRTVFCCLGGAIGADAQQPAAELIHSARVLLVDHHGVEGTLRAVQIARAKGVQVVADFERDPGPPFRELFDAVDHLVLSARFARELTGCDPQAAAESLFSAGRRAVVVTCGAQGCWYLSRQSVSAASPKPAGGARHLPAFPVCVADTTGCGDVFHGAYAATLAAGEAISRCVLVASAAAALKATHCGGQAGIPTRTAVMEFLGG
jgi:ribokinase